jgi:hypothetical protein
MNDNINQGEPLSFFPKGTDGPCPHTGGSDVIEMAESALKKLEIKCESWNGYRAEFVENLPNYMWKSIKTVIACENEKWVIKEIDRRDKLSHESELGFKLISPI